MKGMNKWRGSIRKTLNYKCRRHEGNGKSQLEPHSNSYCRQDPGMDAKISGWGGEETGYMQTLGVALPRY